MANAKRRLTCERITARREDNLDWFDEEDYCMDDPEQWDTADRDESDDDKLDLGPCCACGIESSTVRNIVTLHFKGPTPGHGWGCLQCGLPTDGACCVLCDDCLEKNAKVKYACAGYPSDEVRVPIESLTEPFEHNMRFHREDEDIAYNDDSEEEE